LDNDPIASFATIGYTPNLTNQYIQMEWSQVQSSFTALTDTTKLEFLSTDAAEFGITLVSVVPVPEPTTTILLVVGGVAMTTKLFERKARGDCK
jgi:hypothetical protein